MSFSRNCPNCGTELTYNKLGQLNWANKKNSLCKSCSSKTVQKKLNVEREKNKLVLKCKFCDKEFNTNNKDREFCSRRCMYDWRKSLSRETRICLKCGNKFETYKNTTQRYCSNECNRSSEERKINLSKYFSGKNNNFAKPDVIKKITETKLNRYGTLRANYNENKIKETMIERYGVAYGFLKCRGKVSKLQKEYYKIIKTIHIDAKLEYYLKDVEINVDIFIPSLNKVIEIYGDFWHMNPNKFNKDFINPVSNIKAQDKWKYDKNRTEQLKKAGYDVQIIWESEIK